LLPLSYPCCPFHPPAPPAVSPLSLHDALPICWADNGRYVPEYPELRRRVRSADRDGQGAGHQAAHHRVAADRGRGHLVHRRQHRSEEHTSELQSRENLVCRLLLEKKKA